MGLRLRNPGRRTYYTKTDSVVAVAGRNVVAVSGAAIPRIEVPRATAYYTAFRITSLYPSTAIGWRSLIIFIPVVLTPFIDIAVHIT